MEEVTRKRIVRLLEGLPDEQLYQVLDYIEFLAARYAAVSSRRPDAFQRFAERVEDQMRVRSLAPRALKGTMRIMSTAGKVIDGVRDLGRDLAAPPRQSAASGRAAAPESAAAPDSPAAPDSGESASASAPEVDGPGEGERRDGAADPGRENGGRAEGSA